MCYGIHNGIAFEYQISWRGLARALIIIPWAIPEVVACLVWILMYDQDYGIIISC